MPHHSSPHSKAAGLDEQIANANSGRSQGTGVLLPRRRLIQIGASALTVAAVGGFHLPAIASQRMDPFTFITAMEATTTVGQLVGQPASEVEPISTADGRIWDAYIQVPIKEGQDFHYTCEFDSAWIILDAFGYPMTLDEQLEIVGVDWSIEPWWEETPSAIWIYGGDIAEMYSGDYTSNLLARARMSAVRKVFDAVDLEVTETPDRASTEAALRLGQPILFKSTVDFLDWDPAIWITPDGDEFPVVWTNDHALVVMGFNQSDVIIRDPLGPTTTNEIRPWQYRVSWERYLQVIAAQGNDAIAVGPATATPGTPAAAIGGGSFRG